MKHHFSFFKKALAVFLATFFFCLSAVSFLGILYAIEFDYYTSTCSQLRHEMLIDLLEKEAKDAVTKYLYDDDPVGYYKGTNFRFEIFDDEGTLLLGSLEENEVIESVTYHYQAFFHDDKSTENGTPSSYVIHAYMITTGADVFKTALGFVAFMYAMRFIFIGTLAVFVICTAICFIYLMWAAGKHPDNEKATCGFTEKIPFDLYLLLHLILAVLPLWLTESTISSPILFVALLAMLAVMAFLLLISFGMSISVRIQTKTLWKNTLIYIVFSFIFRKIRHFFRVLPLIWKTVLVVVLYCVFDLIFFAFGYQSYAVFLPIQYLLLFALIPYLAYSFRKLQKGAESIKNGGFSEQIDTKTLHGEFRSFGETLNTISDGLGKAVDAKMKSERMKTELITNVSHDIKTPLTSIINYADLLKKEEISNERAIEYIEVIERQSSRLKKLITDLVEASKASTGNIQVNLERLDVGVLLEQAAGEYDEKFKEAHLIPVLRIPEEPITILADGRLLWRVFDNLLGNICKYSLSGTRVYLNAAVYGDICIISFKNISCTELNISPEELIERFVRADSSRSTEGNGLGLSIAQSLVDLQNGKLEILADGDLFKVNLQFPVIKE